MLLRGLSSTGSLTFFLIAATVLPTELMLHAYALTPWILGHVFGTDMVARAHKSRCYDNAGVGLGSSFYISNEKKQVSLIPTHPPTTCVHMRLVDHTGSMHYMLGNSNACVRRIWDGPVVFQRLQHFTTSKPSTGVLPYATFDIPQSHKGFVRNCESQNLTSPLLTRVTGVFWRKCQSHNFTSPFYFK